MFRRHIFKCVKKLVMGNQVLAGNGSAQQRNLKLIVWNIVLSVVLFQNSHLDRCCIEHCGGCNVKAKGNLMSPCSEKRRETIPLGSYCPLRSRPLDVSTGCTFGGMYRVYQTYPPTPQKGTWD